ncbi:MAG: sodium/solute symporter [Candidatus Eisenbacteria sp.]|nr:sodium/solute symporter [Candidatus Eisenbacteria bacterium]
MIGGLDLFIVIFFIVGVFIVGLYFKRFVHTSEDFFLAGRKLAWWVIGMSIIGTNIGSYDYVGGAGAAYDVGIAQANYEWLGAIPAMVLSALLFVPYYWRAGAYTVPEYLGMRYNQPVRIVEALLWGSFLICCIAIFFWASGVMLETYVGWPIWLGILVTAVVVGIYTVTGGLTAVAMTDVIQLAVMLVGGLAVSIIGFHEVGGWSGLVEKISPEHPDHFKLFLPLSHESYPWLGMIFGLGLVLSPAWWCCHQAIIQRTLGARSEWDAKAGMLSATFLKTLVPILYVLPGLFVLALCAEPLADMDQALPWAIKNLLPVGLAGLVFAAFLAAIFSSVDSTLNSAVTIWTRDIYQNLFVRNASDQHYLRFGRMLTLVFVIIGAFLAEPLTTSFKGIYQAMQNLLTIFQGPTLATVLLGIMWARATQWGGLFGLLGGVACSAILHSTGMNFLYVAWWSFVVALLVNVLISLFTKPEPVEKLRGLVYGLVMKDEQVQENLASRVEGGD